jgi:hypothetical protein
MGLSTQALIAERTDVAASVLVAMRPEFETH